MFAMHIVNLLMFVELVIDWVVFGCKNAYRNHLRVSVETVCQIINGFLLYDFFYSTIINKNNITSLIMHVPWFYVIILIRTLKMLSLLEEIKSLRMIT